MSKAKKTPTKELTKIMLSLLREKHSGDVFVDECKDGPTWAGEHARLDAWAMRKSWSKPMAVAYEIKASRSDFLRDHKWQVYLQYCNELYFVAPTGVIKPEEVPDPAGLMTLTSGHGRLLRRKRAAYREVEIPEPFYRYILFSRAVIARYKWDAGNPETRHELEAWLAQKDDDRKFGRDFGRRLNELVREKISTVNRENVELKKRMGEYDSLIECMKRFDIDPEFPSTWRLERKVFELKQAVDPDLMRTVDNAERELSEVHRAVISLRDRLKEELEKEHQEPPRRRTWRR